MGRHLLSGAWHLSSNFMQPSLFFLRPANCSIPLFRPHRRAFTLISPVTTTPLSAAVVRLRVVAQNRHASSYTATMSTQPQALTEGQSVPSVEGLTLQSTTEQSKFAGCYPSLNPVDIYRAHIAEALGKAIDIDPQLVYPKLAWTSTLDKGDLTLAVRHFLFLF